MPHNHYATRMCHKVPVPCLLTDSLQSRYKSLAYWTAAVSNPLRPAAQSPTVDAHVADGGGGSRPRGRRRAAGDAMGAVGFEPT